MSGIQIKADNIKFEEFCSMLEQVQKKRKQNQEQNKILYKFIDDFRIQVANITGPKDSSLFPFIRLLIPQRDRERNPYNLKEKRLGEVLVKVLSLPKQSQDAQKLLNFRSVQNSSNESDFAAVAYFVLKNRIPQKSCGLTIGDVNDILDKIASIETGNKTTLDTALSYAFKNLTANQLKWFLRIILKDMKLGMSEQRILAAFHPDAPDYFDNHADLKKVCEEFADGDSRPEELGIDLFCAVSPMLSERLSITQIKKILPNKTYLIEDKFDGERFQMHMENGIFEYFSRKGHKYSNNYGETYDSGLLTPHLKGCFSDNVKSIILDGEMMGWNKEHKYFGSKGMAFDIKKVTESSKYRPCFCVFDILFFNGKSLVGSPEKGGLSLKERLKVLENVFSDVQGVIQHSKRTEVKQSDDVLNALNAAIENQDEGIVVKDLNSYYIARKRNAGWYKIKPEYTDSTMTDLDLVVIGAEEAENKRQGHAKSFYVACLDATPGEAARWVCVGRVASGVTYDERERICRILETQWTRSAQSPPPCLRFGKETPDFWLLPDHSIVLQVRATELVRNKDSDAGYSLRFPRITRVRNDKPIADILTLQELNQLASSKAAVVKLSTKRVHADEIAEGGVKVPRKRNAAVPVAEQFRITTGEVPVTSHALLARKLCVLSEDEDCNKAELVRIVQSHGGIHVQNIGPDTWCSVAGKLTDKVKSMLSQPVDIATTQWLRSLPQSESPCELTPLDMLNIKPETRLKLSLNYDCFGDSYKEFTDEMTLKKCFQKMEMNAMPIYLTRNEMLKVDKILFSTNNPFSFLRSCTIYVKKPIYVLTARMYGATVDDDIGNATHVVIANDASNKEIEEMRKTNALIVSEQWLEACFSEKKFVPERLFQFNVNDEENNDV